MSVKHSLPGEYSKTIYKIGANGKIYEWSTWVIENKDGGVFIISKYGVKDSPKIREVPKEIKSGKKKNTIAETTKLQQAILEAESMWRKKRNREGYSTSYNDKTKTITKKITKKQYDNLVLRPMLA